MERTLDLYPNRALSITDCVTVKLSDSNYLLWKSQIESFLSSQSLLGFVTGAVAPPSPNLDDVPNPSYQSWFRCDQAVQSWLLGSMTEEIMGLVIGTKTSQEMWLTLETNFNKVFSCRFFELQGRLQRVTKQDKSMSDYLGLVKCLCDQLASIGNPVSEKMKVFAALHGLGHEYESIITLILSSMDISPGLTYEDVVSHLKRFDDQSYSRGRGSSNCGYTGQRPVCQICGKMGHLAFNCWHRFDYTYQHENERASSHLSHPHDFKGHSAA